jgi:serine/threonine protein phosphatase PrpC
METSEDTTPPRVPANDTRPGTMADELRVDVAFATHVGRRNVNADVVLIDRAAGLFGVADGMGDTWRSRAVAGIALEAVQELFGAPWVLLPPAERATHEGGERLVLGIAQAHGRLYAPGRSREQRIGTTFAGVVACAGALCVAHVGDSRVYLLRRRKARLTQVTEDHTIRGDAVCRGIARHVAAALPRADALTRMLGATPCAEVEPITRSWVPGDVALICTDGVSDCVHAEVMTNILLDVDDLGYAAQAIVERARDAGGGDNATAVLVRWGLV